MCLPQPQSQFPVCLLQDVDPLEAIELELEEEDDAAVFEWFYDDKPLQHTKFVNGPSYSRWRLPLPVMSNLYRLAGQLLSDMTDLNYFYLFNTQVLCYVSTAVWTLVTACLISLWAICAWILVLLCESLYCAAVLPEH